MLCTNSTGISGQHICVNLTNGICNPRPIFITYVDTSSFKPEMVRARTRQKKTFAADGITPYLVDRKGKINLDKQ